MQRELSPIDESILELLASARQFREAEILEAVEQTRAQYEAQDRGVTLAGMLASEATLLHEHMMQLNKRFRISRLVGRRALSLSRGRPVDQPVLGSGTYPVSTPLLLQTKPELAGDARISGGYIFTTYRRPKKDTTSPHLIISHQTEDLFTKKGVTRNLYDIKVDAEEKYAFLSGPAVGEFYNNVATDILHRFHEGSDAKRRQMQKSKMIPEEEIKLDSTFRDMVRFGPQPTDLDHEQYEFPLGLIIQANKELSRSR